jgi:hypothetical protein
MTLCAPVIPATGCTRRLVEPKPQIPNPNQVEAEDILLVGSDGLWNALGGRRAKDDTSECEEDLVGPLLHNIRCGFLLVFCVRGDLPRVWRKEGHIQTLNI